MRLIFNVLACVFAVSVSVPQPAEAFGEKVWGAVKNAGKTITSPLRKQKGAGQPAAQTPGAETAEKRKEIQRRLNELGFDAGAPDGIFGVKTKSSVRAFQESIGEPSTGSLTEGQIKTLYAKTGGALEEPQAAGAGQTGEAADQPGGTADGGVTAAQPSSTPRAPDRPFAVFRDCDGCPEMVEVPAGEFMMGSVAAEREVPLIGNDPFATPRHKVTIGYRFAIGRFEVTTEEFGRYVEETGAKVGGTCLIRLMENGPLAKEYSGTLHPDSHKEENGPFAVHITDGSHMQPGLPVTGRQPAVCVSREEVKGYLGWLAGKTGRNYRLPTEAEWEYAARAGTATVAYWGNDLAEACDYANFGDKGSGYQAGFAAPCAEKIHPGWTADVGSYKPNQWGLYDMAGNVQEMVEDCWHENYEGAPADGSPRNKNGCLLYVARGGDYELMHVSMRASERLFIGYDKDADVVLGPEAAHEARSNVVGFRVSVSLDENAWDSR